VNLSGVSVGLLHRDTVVPANQILSVPRAVMAQAKFKPGERRVFGTAQMARLLTNPAPPPLVASVPPLPQFLEAVILGFSSEGI
jgi:hypothetical protein